MVILDTAFQNASTQLQVNYTYRPMTKCYGISLEDQRLHQFLLRDLITLNQKHETGQQKNMLSYRGASKGNFNLVPITRAASLGQILRKEKNSK